MTNPTKELLKQALDAFVAMQLETVAMQMEPASMRCGLTVTDDAIDALRLALAQPEPPEFVHHSDWYAKCNLVDALQDKVYALEVKCEALSAIEKQDPQVVIERPVESKVDVEDAASVVLEHTQIIRDIGETLNQNGWSLSGQKLQECALAIERKALAQPVAPTNLKETKC